MCIGKSGGNADGAEPIAANGQDADVVEEGADEPGRLEQIGDMVDDEYQWRESNYVTGAFAPPPTLIGGCSSTYEV